MYYKNTQYYFILSFHHGYFIAVISFDGDVEVIPLLEGGGGGLVNACSSFLIFGVSLVFFFSLIHHWFLHEPVHMLDCMPNHKLTSIHVLACAYLPHQSQPIPAARHCENTSTSICCCYLLRDYFYIFI